MKEQFRKVMAEDPPGSIKFELSKVIRKCLDLSPKGDCSDCSDGSHGPIPEWDVSSLTDLNYIFAYEHSFNCDLSKWDVSNVKNMNRIFYYATSFDGDISTWDVFRVTDMGAMFSFASSFNGDISKWDVSQVMNMQGMFSSASSFNSDISAWDVSRVRTMQSMFSEAKQFAQKLCGAAWVHSRAFKKDMFKGSSGSISNTGYNPTQAFSSAAELRRAVQACSK